MDTINRISGIVFEALMAGLGWMSPGWSLAVISTLLGAVMLVAFKLIGNPDDLGAAMGRMQAHMMEMRLFDREPKLVFVAMGRLFWWNFKLIAALLRPALVASLPMLFLFIQMDHYYGMRPLQVGESTVVTARITDKKLLAAKSGTLNLLGDASVEVVTPPVYSPKRGIVSWRVEARSDGVGVLQLEAGPKRFAKTVDVSELRARVSKRRARKYYEAMLFPIEPRLRRGAVRWIDVRYPVADVNFLGLTLHWLIWLLIISLVGAFIVRWVVNAWRPNTL